MSAALAPRPLARPLPRPSRRRRARRQRLLGGGSIGHILRNRTMNPETYAATDRWFHYDQVGSVLFRSNASGNSIGYRLADAFGNQLASATTGTALWASDAASAGWGHNTKEHGAATGLVYMYQRWYMPETGTFLSTAPYPPMMEHPYDFAAGNPVMGIDPDGRQVIYGGGSASGAAWGGYGSISAGLAADIGGNAGLYLSMCAGIGGPLFGSAGGEVGVSLSRNLQRWSGLSGGVGVGGGTGPAGVTGGMTIGSDFMPGIEVSGGPGVGLMGYGCGCYTMTVDTNVPNLAASGLIAIEKATGYVLWWLLDR